MELNRHFLPTIAYRPDQPSHFDFSQQVEFQARPALQLARDEIQIHRVTSVDFRTDSVLVQVIDRGTGLR